MPLEPLTLALLVALLGLHGQGRDRAGEQTPHSDRLSGLLARAEASVGDPLQGGVDLREELAIAPPGAQLQCQAPLAAGPVGLVPHVRMTAVPYELHG